jgi:P4 family phage/plasmid primase-like protien
MSYNKYLNEKINTSCDFNVEISILELINRNSEDYFFNKSDLNKMEHFKNLINRYKLCNKEYYYFNEGSKLWEQESTDDKVINRICEETEKILNPEKKYVLELLYNIQKELNVKKTNNSISVEEQNKLTDINEAIKEFNKFIEKTIKEHQKTKFARSVLSFFHHNIIDPDFMRKININNHHLLPLKTMNLNLKTMKMEERIKEQYFTKCLNIIDIKDEYILHDAYKQVDNFFNDICSNHKPKKDYLQKILGYFLTGSVPLGRCFFIFFGAGKNGKSAMIEVIQEIMGSFYCKSVESSVIVKRGKKNSGQASPELEVLDYGCRLSLLSETDENDSLNESLIKNITGYDSITYRPLYGKQLQMTTETKLLMLTNNKPYFTLSTSMVDRLRFIDFKSRFLSEPELIKENAYNENKTLKPNYYKAEPELIKQLKMDGFKEYVLLWMAIGAKKFYIDEHLNIPNDPILQKENLSYINELDSVQRFIDEWCIVGPNEKIVTSEAKVQYTNFCSEVGIPAVKPAKFKDTILSKFDHFNVIKNSNQYYHGFNIKPQPKEEYSPQFLEEEKMGVAQSRVAKPEIYNVIVQNVIKTEYEPESEIEPDSETESLPEGNNDNRF